MTKITPDDPRSRSLDTVAANLQALREIIPGLVAEGSGGPVVDIDVLRQHIGAAANLDTDERYGLSWHGKRRSRLLALTPSTGTLRPCPGESLDWDTTRNLFLEGDNLEVLKLLQRSYAGRVKLVYIDPPYNTGSDFVYPDDFQDSLHNYLSITGQVDGGAQISSNAETGGRFHTNWLNMMYPRLLVARTLLRHDGAICVSLDDTELPTFRLIANEVFGEENFLAVIAWEKVHTRKNSAKTFSVKHDYVVVYARDAESWDRVLLPREGPSAYSNPDKDPKGPWKPDPVTAHNPYSADYSITKPNGIVLQRPPGRYWAFSEQTWLAKVAAGEVLWGNGDGYPMIKRYLSEVQDGLVPETLFTRDFAGDTASAKREIDDLFGTAGVFDYPKPTLLIRRLLQICTRPTDLVLDFFAGSGTTGHAVMAQNAADGGSRSFILVQLPEPLKAGVTEQRAALEFCEELQRPSNIAELTKERLRRASALVRKGAPLFAGDLGFRVFRLDRSNIREWSPDSSDLPKTLTDSVEHVREGRSDEDILYEVLLKFGLDLAAPIEVRKIAGKSVHSIGAGTLMVCLAPKIARGSIEPLADGIVAWHKEQSPGGDSEVILRDSAFDSDVAKTNLTEILKQGGLTRVRSL